MSTLYISEYTTTNAMEPALKTQAIAIEAESHASEPFAVQTKAVRLHADAPCSIRFGTAAATTDDPRLVGTEVFEISHTPRAGVAVIANGESASMEPLNILTALLNVIADPAAARARLNELTTRGNDVMAQLAALTGRERAVVLKEAELVEHGKALALREAALMDRNKALTEAESQVKLDQQGLAAARLDHNTQVERFTATQKEWEQAKKELETRLSDATAHEKMLHERERTLKTGELALETKMTRLRELAQ
jgi:hypothetical protein